MRIYIALLLILFFSYTINPETIVDLDIESAQQMAVINNKEIKIKKMTRNISERKYWLGFSKFFPQLSTSYSFSNMVLNTYETNTTYFYDTPYSHTLTLTANQLLFDGGQSIANKYLQFYDLKLKSKSIEEEEKQIFTQIEAIYSEIYFQEKKIEQQKRKIEYLHKEYDIIQTKLDLELITELDYSEFLLKLNEADIELAQIERQFNYITGEFKYLIGLDEETIVRFVSRLEIHETEIDEKYADTFSLMTISQSSKSNSIQLNLYKSKLKQVMTYMGFIPVINMNFAYTFEGESWQLDKKGWELGFTFAWGLPGFPITMNNKLKFPLEDEEKQASINQRKQMLGYLETGANIKLFEELESINKFSEAHIGYLKAQYEHEKFLNETEKNLKKTIKEYNEYIKILGLNRKREEILRKKIQIEKVKFEQGSGRFVDVMQSEMKLFETEISIIDIENKIYKNIIAIKNLTGINTDEFYNIIR